MDSVNYPCRLARSIPVTRHLELRPALAAEMLPGLQRVAALPAELRCLLRARSLCGALRNVV